MKQQPEHILLFDGVCNLCSGVVQFILRNDRKKRIMMASLQSDFGREFMNQHSLSTTEFKSFIYLRNGKVHQRSTAFLYLMRDLGALYRLLEVLWIVPGPLRDMVYDLVARNRYRWFGTRDQCYVPEKDVSNRFIGN